MHCQLPVTSFFSLNTRGKRPPKWTPTKECLILRLSFWELQRMNLNEMIQIDFSTPQDLVCTVNTYLNSRNMSAHQVLRQSFMSMVSRALLSVSGSTSVSSLKKDAAFRVLCTDQSEGPDEGFRRLSEIVASGT